MRGEGRLNVKRKSEIIDMDVVSYMESLHHYQT